MNVLYPDADGSEPQPLRLRLDGKSEPILLPPRSRPSCDICQTDKYLVFEKVAPVCPPGTSRPIAWDVDCWCGKCESYYGFRARSDSHGQYMV
jgi:hypothetical protein